MKQYGVLPTYWSIFVVLAAAMITGMSASTELSNLALNRPCAPHPWCRLLVNGLAENAGLNGEISNGDGDADLDNTALVLATPPKSFMSFLSSPSFVERIVVHCRRKKTVTGGFLEKEPSEDRSPILPPKIKVTLWSKFSTADSKEPIDVQVNIDMSHNSSFKTTPSVQESLGDIRLEIQINLKVVAVQLEVRKGDGLCGPRKEATQVALLGHGDISGVPRRKDVAITAAASRRQSLNMMPRESADKIDMVDAVSMLPASAGDQQLKEIIEPHEAGRNLGFVVYICVVVSLFLLFAYLCSDTKASRFEPIAVSTQPVLRASSELTSVGASASLGHQTSATSFFYIGDTDNESTATSAPFYIGDTDVEPEQDQVSNIVTASCSEPEPDAELFPSSCPGTPRLTDGSSVVTCVGTKAQVVQPTASSQLEVDNTWTSSSSTLPQALVSAKAPERRSVEMCRPRSMQAMFSRAIRRRQSCDKQVVMMFASPLYCGRQELPQFAFEKEWNLLIQAHDDSVQSLLKKSRKLPPFLASLAPRALTAANLQSMLVPSDVDSGTKILHLSAHGTGDGKCLILENGTRPCTGHLYSLEELRMMLALRSESHALIGPRLVFLNACHSRAAGMQFAQSGVPHVIYGHGSLNDKWSRLFVHKLYTCLFQGRTVMEAYKAAIVALHNDPNCPKVAAKSFCLLPDDHPHDEVLFPLDQCIADETAAASAKMSSDASEVEDASSSQASDSEREYSSSKRSEISRLMRLSNPLNSAVPALPEDFTGRSQDVYTVLQLVKDRRLVMVCGSHSSGHGIGKSVVVDAVHRALTMQMGAICVDVRNHGHECPNLAEWIMQTREAVRKLIARSSRSEGAGTFQRCVRPRKCFQNSWQYQTSVASAAYQAACLSCSPDTLEIDMSMESLVRDLEELANLSLEEKKWWPATAPNGLFQENGGAILVFDSCEELLQQPYFQNAIVDILSRCPGYHVLFSAQRPPAHSWCRYKIAQHQLEGLKEKDAAHLFLKRTNRPLQWKELQLGTNESSMADCSPSGEVVLPAPGPERDKILELVAKQPAIAAQQGNPRALIELAHKVDCSLQSLQDLSQNSLVKARAVQATQMAMAPIQGSMSSLDAQTIGSPSSFMAKIV